MNHDHHTSETCSECGTTVAVHHRYCKNCGAYLGDQAVSINIFNNQALRQLFFFYFIYLFICLMVKHTSWFGSYDQLFWIELLLAIITGTFAWQNRKQVLPLLRIRQLKGKLLAGVLLTAIFSSVLVSLSIREVNITFFNSEVSYYQAFKMYHFPVALMIYSIAVLPAFFEELAFRGVMYNFCASFLDERLVVAVTAFLFAIMHLSLISLVWLLPFGFFLGYMRQRYRTIWYGVAFHFMFNLTAVLIDLYRQGILFTF